MREVPTFEEVLARIRNESAAEADELSFDMMVAAANRDVVTLDRLCKQSSDQLEFDNTQMVADANRDRIDQLETALGDLIKKRDEKLLAISKQILEVLAKSGPHGRGYEAELKDLDKKAAAVMQEWDDESLKISGNMAERESKNRGYGKSTRGRGETAWKGLPGTDFGVRGTSSWSGTAKPATDWKQIMVDAVNRR